MQPAATILIVKSGISNHAASGILDELCFSKFGTFHAACPQSADNFRTYVQHLPCSRIKHNRAKPMFELASALFSIADVNEFRFARFYIVYEEARLVLLGSPSIVCELPDTPRGMFQTWKDTAFDAGRGTEELPGFYSKESAAAGYIGTLWFPHFCLQLISCTLSRLPGLSNTALPF